MLSKSPKGRPESLREFLGKFRAMRIYTTDPDPLSLGDDFRT